MPTPDISIILINYNSIQYTQACLESILSSQGHLNYEVILVDNASEQFDPTSLPQDSRIQIVTSDKNLGFAKGNNLGIASAKGTYILLLNNDTIVNESSIVPVLNQLKSDPSIGAITCQLRYPDGKVQHNCQPFPNFLKRTSERLRIHKLFSGSFRSKWMQGFYFDYNQPGEPDWIWGTYFMFHRQTLNQLPSKKLNDDYFMYMEDAQWCLDMRKAGFRIVYSPKSYIVHFGGGSNGAKSELMINSEQLFLKNFKSGN